MKKLTIIPAVIFLMVINIFASYSAHVLKDKEEAEQYSTKNNIYSIIGVQDGITQKGSDEFGNKQSDDEVNRFTAVTATKNGNTYTNTWSNYKITFTDDFFNGNDYYDFNGDGIKFDFGIYFSDYSRIAVFYSRLSSDLNVVASRFSENNGVDDVVIAGHVFKHTSKDVPYPYGVETYNYYLREIDQKLMVIETFHEGKYDTCRKYIDEFEPAK